MPLAFPFHHHHFYHARLPRSSPLEDVERETYGKGPLALRQQQLHSQRFVTVRSIMPPRRKSACACIPRPAKLSACRSVEQVPELDKREKAQLRVRQSNTCLRLVFVHFS